MTRKLQWIALGVCLLGCLGFFAGGVASLAILGPVKALTSVPLWVNLGGLGSATIAGALFGWALYKQPVSKTPVISAAVSGFAELMALFEAAGLSAAEQKQVVQNAASSSNSTEAFEQDANTLAARKALDTLFCDLRRRGRFDSSQDAAKALLLAVYGEEKSDESSAPNQSGH